VRILGSLRNQLVENTRLLIVDDHGRVRESLQFVFGAAGMRHLEEATTCHDALCIVQKGLTDVVLLDLNLRDGDGLETLRKMKGIDSDLPVLIHSYHDGSRMLSRSYHSGACGYLVKGGDKNILIDAVRKASQGESVWTFEQRERIHEADAENGTPCRPTTGG
jgi:two-component system, NarL family, invasion response regulator UvrY